MARQAFGPAARRLAVAALVLALGALARGSARAADAPLPAPAPPEVDTSAALAATADTAKAPALTVNPVMKGSIRKVRLDKKPDNVVRSGPGESFSIVGVYPKNSTFVVIAKSGEWYNVRLSDAETAWVHSSLCREFDDLSDLEFRPNPKLYTRTGSFVVSGYAGAYAFDRKSNSLVLGGRLGYYVFDRILVEGGLAWTHVNRPAEIVESLFNLSLEAEKFHMLFYQMNVTWQLLPGRQMVPYLSGGVGSSIMQGRTEPSINFGAGTEMFLSKRTSVRWEFRDYTFKTGSDNARVTTNNVEFTLATAYLF